MSIIMSDVMYFNILKPPTRNATIIDYNLNSLYSEGLVIENECILISCFLRVETETLGVAVP